MTHRVRSHQKGGTWGIAGASARSWGKFRGQRCLVGKVEDVFWRYVFTNLAYTGVFQRGTAGLISLETSCRSLLVYGQSGYFIIETYLFLSNAGLTVRPHTVVSGTAACVRKRARKRSTAWSRRGSRDDCSGETGVDISEGEGQVRKGSSFPFENIVVELQKHVDMDAKLTFLHVYENKNKATRLMSVHGRPLRGINRSRSITNSWKLRRRPLVFPTASFVLVCSMWHDVLNLHIVFCKRSSKTYMRDSWNGVCTRINTTKVPSQWPVVYPIPDFGFKELYNRVTCWNHHRQVY